MKILLWIVFIAILLLGLRVLNIAKARQRDNARRSSTVPPPEPMIRCACCGVYLPQKDAIAGPAGLTCGEPACLRPR
jgi:uncharacterized protein